MFNEGLSKIENFTYTDQPGPDVLTLEIGLADVVSFVPPNRSGRDQYYISNLGQALLVMQIKDSQSNEVLARVADRRNVEPTFVQESNPVTNIQEVKRSFAVWPDRIRRGLDELHNLGCFQCDAP